MQQLRPLIGCRYLAGHWENDLLWQLGWFILGEGVHPTDYRAPS